MQMAATYVVCKYLLSLTRIDYVQHCLLSHEIISLVSILNALFTLIPFVPLLDPVMTRER
jgi:hypothetical protein